MRKKSNLNLAIIHFQPLERFPPVINLLNFLETYSKEKVLIVSTMSSDNSLKTYSSNSANIRIIRTAAIIPASIYRIFHYLFFYLYSFYLLLKNKPGSVLYFETLSSWPALMYKKLRGNKVRLLLHYHEYTSPESYDNDMRLSKWMHQWEIKLYKKNYNWISHTNELRLEKFKSDYDLQNVSPTLFHTMPNYPSRLWVTEKTKSESENKIRLIYVGSLGYDNMYLKETIDWILLNKEFLSLDFYAYNIDKKAKDLLNSVNDNCIKYSGGCSYEDLPGVLRNYDVGLVLYKPYNFNHINGVSNKVFEYLACGLDVWFPHDNTYTLSFERNTVFPKIVSLDFKNLNDFDFRTAFNRTGIKHQPTDYYYENIYSELYTGMTTR